MNPAHTSGMWWSYALLSAVFAAATAILAKLGTRDIDANVATAIRTGVVLVLAWGIVLFQGKLGSLGAIPRGPLLFLVLSGFATGLSWLFYFKALQSGPVGLVSAVDKSSLALTLLLAALVLGESLTLRTAAGCGLILAGTAVLVWP